jgi:hemerythrin superfamily protein
MDAIELLSHDHRMVEQLFRDYRSAASERQRRGVVEIMVRELSKHAALEELMVYPLAKKVLANGGQAEVDQHLREHMEVKKLLAELDACSEGDPRMDQLMEQLQPVIAEHVQEEEGTFFPELRSHVDQQALTELGSELAKAKDRAPTRPHPAAPDEPPALALAAPVAAIYDRLRDRLQGRPRT